MSAAMIGRLACVAFLATFLTGPAAAQKAPSWDYPRSIHCTLAMRWASENEPSVVRPGELERARLAATSNSSEGRTPQQVEQYLVDAWGQLLNGYAAGYVTADALRGLAARCAEDVR
jgi:hypothetical protein